jgi:hypothetical protein
MSETYHLPRIKLPILLVEIGIVIIFATVVASPFNYFDPKLEVEGTESEWLTNSAQLASQSLREQGTISLWQPWLNYGEPAIDNPFSFILNPISSVPSMIMGANNGIKLSIILYIIFAGLGGWLLGYVLGFGSLARLLLALLLIGKGNMASMLTAGLFQLGTTQAYLPWITAAALAVLRVKRQRWPVILLVIVFTLLFWAGNIYYTLPALVIVVLLTLTHTFTLRHDESRWRLGIDTEPLRRILVAGVLIVGLAAISLFPIWINQGYIGGHPNETGAGTVADLGTVISRFFNGDTQGLTEPDIELYYSFVLPIWFAILIFIVIPPIYPALHRPANGRSNWRVWSVGLVMIVFFTLWGSGVNPIVGWLYEHVQLLGQWRFVGRMLAVSSFWIAVVVAMRVDGLWRAIVSWYQPNLGHWLHLRLSTRTLATLVAALLIVISTLAAVQVNRAWSTILWLGPKSHTDNLCISAQGSVLSCYGSLIPESPEDDLCISWLRAQYPTKQLALITQDYQTITSYQRNHVRTSRIAANFHPQPITPTIFQGKLFEAFPEYSLAWDDKVRGDLVKLGYQQMMNSPAPIDNIPCLWHNPNALPYAFSIPKPVIDSLTDTLPVTDTQEITALERHLDRIALQVTGDSAQPLVVSVSEMAYPGWMVQVDGVPAHLESVGGLIGVVLPPGATPHYVYFQYEPPLLFLGGALTLFTTLVCILYLLHAERFILPRLRRGNRTPPTDPTV